MLLTGIVLWILIAAVVGLIAVSKAAEFHRLDGLRPRQLAPRPRASPAHRARRAGPGKESAGGGLEPLPELLRAHPARGEGLPVLPEGGGPAAVSPRPGGPGGLPGNPGARHGTDERLWPGAGPPPLAGRRALRLERPPGGQTRFAPWATGCLSGLVRIRAAAPRQWESLPRSLRLASRHARSHRCPTTATAPIPSPARRTSRVPVPSADAPLKRDRPLRVRAAHVPSRFAPVPAPAHALRRRSPLPPCPPLSSQWPATRICARRWPSPCACTGSLPVLL